MIDLKHLRVLIEIVDRGTFSAAAEALSYTQGAVSQQIGALEKTIGAPVLNRGSRPLQPTPQGQVLIDHGRAIFEQFATARAELDAIASMGGGRLHLGSFPTATIALAAPAVAAFRRQYPAVETRIIDFAPDAALAALETGEIELAIIFDYDIARVRLRPGVHVQHLRDDPMLLALPADHSRAYDENLHLADLASEHWVCGKLDRCAAALGAACDRAGFSPQVTSETSDYETAKALVSAGIGLSLLPHLASSDLPETIVLRPLSGLPIRRIFAVTLGPRASRSATALLSFLRPPEKGIWGERVAV